MKLMELLQAAHKVERTIFNVNLFNISSNKITLKNNNKK